MDERDESEDLAVSANTLREEILAGRKFGGFDGFDKNPPN